MNGYETNLAHTSDIESLFPQKHNLKHSQVKSCKISIYIHHYIMLPSLHMKYQPTVWWKWIYVTGELSGIIGKKCSMLQKS